jgi:hypothetical protein
MAFTVAKTINSIHLIVQCGLTVIVSCIVRHVLCIFLRDSSIQYNCLLCSAIVIFTLQILAGMDVTTMAGRDVIYEFNITGYPTIVYFE